MANDCMRRYLISLGKREIQVKTTVQKQWYLQTGIS